MKGLEKIQFDKRVVAIVFRHTLSVNNVQFFTDHTNPFQVGAHKRAKGTKLTPHTHRVDKPLVISTIQEILFIKSGKIRLTMYTPKGSIIARKTLVAGDSVLLMEMAHGVDFLEESEIFEVKQGPYPGLAHAKHYL